MELNSGTSTGSRILVIDDDADISELLTIILKSQGIVVYHACDGKDGLRIAYEIHPDLIILDVVMPELDGWEVCIRLREMTDAPILMLTARSAESDVVRAFALGVDDYVKKPFSKVELEARVRALLRRNTNHGMNSNITHYADRLLTIDLETQVVELEGQVLDLSATEYNLLACLVRNSGRTVTHNQLLREVWGCENTKLSTSLSLYIYYLRKKLQVSHPDHEYIHTQWGRGYCFMPINEI